MRLSRKIMRPFTAADQREEPLAQQAAERQALIEKRKEQLYEAIAQSFTPVGAPITLGSGAEALRFPVASTYSTREEIIQGCRAQQQFCSQQAEENAQTALMVENMGDWATSQRLWERAAHNQGLSDYFGQAAARYESAPAPMTAPQPTAPSPTQEEDEPEEALSYEENLRLAMENYPIYQEKRKDLKVNYLWMRDPEADAGYHPANMEMQQYREGYLAPMDDILDNLERIVPTGVTGTPVTAAERESLLVQRDQLIQELWDLYHASDGELDPAAAAIYTDQIARLNAVLAAEPTEARYEDVLLQMLGGNYYTGESTLAGVGGQVALGTLGLDLAADVRDISYDLSHLDSVTPGQIALDAIGVLPLVGGLKYADEAADVLKHADDLADAAADAGKNADELVETGGDVVYNGTKSFGDIELKPDDLMEELASSGKKYTEEDVILVAHNSDGDLLWLEKGNPNNGWKHILEKHGGDFSHDDGSIYSPEEIQSFMKELLDSEPIAQGVNNNGPYAIYAYNGKNYRIGWGDNGYIKSFYPDSGWKK